MTLYLRSLTIVACVAILAVKATISNVNVHRSSDLMEMGGNLLIFKNQITFESTGEAAYYYAVATDYEHQFISLQATTDHPLEKDRQYYLRVTNATAHDISDLGLSAEKLANTLLFKINLEFNLPEASDNLAKAGKHVITVAEYHKNRREPYPKSIHVYEKQKVELYESKYFLSVYPSESQSLTLKVQQENVHYTSQDPTTKDQFYVRYGPYRNVAPLSFDQLQIFFTYPYPLPVFDKATRDIYVSHWGSVAVDEFFSIKNEGAGIKG